MATYPRKITVEFLVNEDGTMEITNKEGKPLSEVLGHGKTKTIKAHNAIGVLITNPSESVCWFSGGKLYCY